MKRSGGTRYLYLISLITVAAVDWPLESPDNQYHLNK